MSTFPPAPIASIWQGSKCLATMWKEPGAQHYRPVQPLFLRRQSFFPLTIRFESYGDFHLDENECQVRAPTPEGAVGRIVPKTVCGDIQIDIGVGQGSTCDVWQLTVVILNFIDPHELLCHEQL